MDYPEKAIPHFKDALDKAREIDMSRLIGSSLYNLGLCSFAEEAYEKTAEYFKEGIRVYQDNGYEHSNRLLDINVDKNHIQNEEQSEGISWCAHGCLCPKI